MFQGSPYVVNGCIVNFLEHMVDEYTKILTYHDFSSDKEIDYRDKLHYKTQFIELCSTVSDYINRKGNGTEDKCRVYMRQLEHIYYRIDSIAEGYKEIKKLSIYIISYNETDRLRTRAS